MSDATEAALTRAISALGPPLLRTLHALEGAFRRLHPPEIPRLCEALAPLAEPLRRELGALRATDAPDDLAGIADQLERAAEAARDALVSFLGAAGAGGAAPILHAMRAHADAQALLYPLWRILPPVSRYFLEPACWDRAGDFDAPVVADARVGIHHARDDAHERGGFTLYVPERHDGHAPLALVVALHGGGGHGRAFLWSWLREARSRGFALMAPTSRGSTWSLAGPDLDAASLRSMVEAVSGDWPIDPRRILLTGLSDGATYTLLGGLREDSPFTAFAPVSGVLHPANFANGNLARAAGRRVYLVHGALDWMFPVALARAAAEELTRAGADLTYRELPDLSHTYPRDENDPILRWFDPALAHPPTSSREAAGSAPG